MTTSQPDTNTQVEARVPQLPNTPDHFARFFTNYLKAVPEELERAGCKRPFLLVSGSLDSKTDRIRKLELVLNGVAGIEVVGKKVGVKAHTPYTDVIELTEQLWKAKADSIVVVGSSSYTDCAKVAMTAHSSFSEDNPLTVDAIQLLSIVPNEHGTRIPSNDVISPTLKLFLVPTSLSAAEYNPGSGATNPSTRHKHSFYHPQCRATCVILDPELCTTTPPRLWLGSGMRAVDHCVETLCVDSTLLKSMNISQDAVDVVNTTAKEGLRDLLRGLAASQANPQDVKALATAQIGAWYAIRSILFGFPLGASHAIGHQLGSIAGVPHGETSCVMLSWVLKYNKVVNAEQQESVKKIFWESTSEEEWSKRGLTNETTDAGDLVRSFVEKLGLPTRLSEVGVTDEGTIGKVAESTLKDVWGKTNPRPLQTKDDVLEILRMAA